MIDAISYHGQANDQVEFYATIRGLNVHQRLCMQQLSQGLLFFGDQNQVRIFSDSIAFQGNGGLVSEYMFDSRIPLEDLFIPEVMNRLVLFGAYESQDDHKIYFTKHTSGEISFNQLFTEGHAFCNYLFFIADHNPTLTVVERQELNLKKLGKILKRSKAISVEDDVKLLNQISDYLNEPTSDIFLFRFVHRPNKTFYHHCLEIYQSYRGFPDHLMNKGMAIDTYHKERIKMHIIYRHKDNEKLIHQYRQVLKEIYHNELNPSLRARLQRIRTLALRNNIPPVVFDTLEEIAFQDKPLAITEQEPEYLARTRQILEGFLIESGPFTHEVSKEELISLLEAKQKAVEFRDNAFEEILLDVGRLLDEKVMESEDFSLLESFGAVVTYLDRFDATADFINKLAFMEEIEIDTNHLRSLLNNRKIFNELEETLFERLFITPLLRNPYINRYGKRKLNLLQEGLIRIGENEMTLQELLALLSQVSMEERIFKIAYDTAKDYLSHFYMDLHNPKNQKIFMEELQREIQQGGLDAAPRQVLQDVIHTLQMESLYVNELIPLMVKEKNLTLREDFLKNSGLDLFTLETIEQEYMALDKTIGAQLESLLNAHVA